MLKLIPMFKAKYRVEKMNFITLTDGGSNYSGNHVYGFDKESKQMIRQPVDYGGKEVFIYKKKYYTAKQSLWSHEKATTVLLDMIKQSTGSKVIGFYLIKRIRRWDTERYLKPFDSKLTWEQTDKIYTKNKQAFTKDKVCAVKQSGYDEYYVINAKDMKVENTDLSKVNGDMKAGKIRQLFSKSMKSRLTSRVLLNKFIQQVA